MTEVIRHYCMKDVKKIAHAVRHKSPQPSCSMCGYNEGGEVKEKKEKEPSPSPTPVKIEGEETDKFKDSLKKSFGFYEGGEVNLREESEADHDEDDVILTNGQSSEFLDGNDDPSEPKHRLESILRKNRLKRIIDR